MSEVRATDQTAWYGLVGQPEKPLVRIKVKDERW